MADLSSDEHERAHAELSFASADSTAYRRFLERLARLPEVEREAERAARDAEVDSLTGLYNRRGLVRRTRRHGGASWFVFCDLDGFKRAQDANPGHHAYGDDVLREFAHFLREGTRGADVTLAREGGDEFVVRVDSRAGARRVRDLVRAWRSADGAVSASAGLGADVDAADCACHLNKEDRRAAMLPTFTAAWFELRKQLQRRMW
jgi:GGDEF domain-containing protein